MGLDHASDAPEALARTFALGTPADVRRVYVDGEPVTADRTGPVPGESLKVVAG